MLGDPLDRVRQLRCGSGAARFIMRRVNVRQLEDKSMRMLISLVVIVYLVGIGVELAPTFRANWNTVPASQLAESLVQELPSALAWPAAVYRRMSAAATSP